MTDEDSVMYNHDLDIEERDSFFDFESKTKLMPSKKRLKTDSNNILYNPYKLKDDFEESKDDKPLEMIPMKKYSSANF